MRGKILLLVSAMALLLVGSAGSGCQECGPLPDSRQEVVLQFYRYDSLLSAKKRIALNMSFERINAEGLLGSLPSETTAAQLALMLPTNRDTVAFRFEAQGGAEDLLLLSFKRTFIPVPPDCGASVQYSDLSIVSHSFDSARVKYAVPTYQLVPHIEIFE